MNAQATPAIRLSWAQLLIGGIGVGILLIGARDFQQRGAFSLSDALVCVLLLVPCALLVLVTSYVVQHAKIAAVIPVVAIGLFVHTYAAFAVAMGLVVAGVVLAPAVGEWRNARNERTATPASGGSAPLPPS